MILLISNITQDELERLKEQMIKTFDNKLMIPSTIHIVEDVPKLGTGKKDFKAAKNLAVDLE